jgi:hypothetical protein
VFQRLVERPDLQKGFRDNPKGYLYRAAINEALNLIGAQQREGWVDEDVAEFEMPAPASNDDIHVVRAAMHILLAARQLGEKATAVSIALTVEQWTGHQPIVSLALERMEKVGLIAAGGTGDARRFQVTELGSRALRRAKAEGKKLPVVEGITAEEKDLIEGGAAEEQ